MDCRYSAVGDSGGGNVHLSCQLLVFPARLPKTCIKRFLRKTPVEALVWVGRTMVLVVALIAIALAGKPEQTVLAGLGELCPGRLRRRVWSGGALFSVMWSRMTHVIGALAGMVIGALTVIVWKTVRLLGLYEIIPALSSAARASWSCTNLLEQAPSASIQQRALPKRDASIIRVR